MSTLWTDEQIEHLRRRQADRTLHPYTCGGLGPDDVCHRARGVDDGVLIPTREGFVCPCGEYRQEWVHDADNVDAEGAGRPRVSKSVPLAVLAMTMIGAGQMHGQSAPRFNPGRLLRNKLYVLVRAGHDLEACRRRLGDWVSEELFDELQAVARWKKKQQEES